MIKLIFFILFGGAIRSFGGAIAPPKLNERFIFVNLFIKIVYRCQRLHHFICNIIIYIHLNTALFKWGVRAIYQYTV